MNLIQRDVNTGDLTNRVKHVRLLLVTFGTDFTTNKQLLSERMMHDKTKCSSDKLAIWDVVVIKDNTTTPRSK